MFRLSRGPRYRRVRPTARRRSEGKSVIGNGKANIETGERRLLTASKTRGEPSTSTNLKEALCEKIPVYHDLLRNFRRHFGPSVVSHITVNDLYQGLNGVRTVVRETSEVDPNHGIMYRGLSIPEVMALLPRRESAPSAEAVFWLLLTGDVPTHQQTASLIADWTSRRQKCTEWWSGSRGETMVSVLRSLPGTINSLGRLSVALAIFDVNKYAKDAKRYGAMPHTYWEYVYEDGMEFLASLPAIIGLIAKRQMLTNARDDGDWVQFLLECLTDEVFDGRRSSVADFLRLYITLNADDDGGSPIPHITHILGSTDLNINEVLASNVLAYTNEPASGTMLQWMELKRKIEDALGKIRTDRAFEDCVLKLCDRDRLIAHREAEFCDPRYMALLNYAKQYLPDNTEIKFSQDITRVLTWAMRRPKRRNIFPEQSALAAPLFQSYGMKDMTLNQTILYMARALGAVASIIWTKAVNAPVEHPISKCTHGYIESIRDDRKKKTKYRARLIK